MKIKNALRWGLPAAVLALIVSGCVAAPASPVGVTLTVSSSWTATAWSSEDQALFGGIPQYHGTDRDLVLVQHSYYVSNYDADRLCPLWVAHVDVGDTTEKAKARVESKDPKWKRIPFYPDPVVVTYSTSHNLPYVVDDSYNNPNPPEFPGVEGTPTHLTRGHNAPNEEMKLEGDEEQGAIAQRESFSLANVSPQTQHHNAPLWAALEADCLVWSAKLGRVAVLTGPIFAPETEQPMPVDKIIYTHGKKGPQIPVPTHFFKIIIGEIDGKVAAIGFLVPHLSNLAKVDYQKYAVPVSKIEEKTSLTFMPDYPRNSTLKTVVDARWLKMINGH